MSSLNKLSSQNKSKVLLEYNHEKNYFHDGQDLL